jgi:hypothetical protein
MNFKSVTINLLLTTLSAGVLLQTLEAQAASITFDTWTLNKATVTASSNARGYGFAVPHLLGAFGVIDTSPHAPRTWFFENVTTIVSLSNFFTVTAEKEEKNGEQVKGYLFGNLIGLLVGGGLDVAQLTGSFEARVNASVDAGFASFSSSAPPHSNSVLLLGISPKNVNEPFDIAGNLTIGQRYPFNMRLEVSASKTGVYAASSDFIGDGQGFTAFVRAESVPEPLTMLASATALGFGAFFKREHSKNQKKC